MRRTMSDGRFMRWKEIFDLGVSRTSITRMARDEILMNEKRGVYYLAFDQRVQYYVEDQKHGLDEGTLEEYQEMLSIVPKGIISLLSAARLHDITLEVPSEVWMCLKHGSYIPDVDDYPIRIVVSRNPDAMKIGVMEVPFRGTSIRVTDLERTVVDLYRLGSKLSDPALPRKSLIKAMEKPEFSRGKLYEYSRALGVGGAIRQDIETVDLVAKPALASAMRA